MPKYSLKLAQNSEINALEKVVKSLSALSDIEKVVCFGSRVRGDFVGSSDIDLLVILTDIKMKDIVISILHDIELEFDVPLSPVIFTAKEYLINKKLKSNFIKNVEREGIVLYASKHKG